ncbi:agmatine deiminase family protein [Helicobacter sp. 11S02629-2]|uniref:agmatine deiminase family protein n=1 Tax=Helicobacter sp. 11S02629-2 TaxID=1476195 RepID=UPI000BA5CE2D|nr:agmatine deiminase family protein [Helicobacter sp. 11S02629-2]PAF44384.1 hypothetical protein BKH40_05675 [Helicobacter sp. 11S02629-2]
MYAEWEKQRAVVLIYPHKFCDFKDDLKAVRKVYDEIISNIETEVWLIKHTQDSIRTSFKENVRIIEIDTNDLWARDSLAISIKPSKASPKAHLKYTYKNFGFNGWGLKFAADLDNQINAKLACLGFLKDMKTESLILEGGSIDCNSKGDLLTNTQCLLSPNRNPALSKDKIESKLLKELNVKRVHWLSHGFLLGDDTDSHIDTLARFIDDETIAYIKCDDPKNVHFKGLELMEQELEALPFKLVALPFCDYVHEGEALPASYVNFLFTEGKLLVPLYGKPSDAKALEVLREALPQYEVIGINCEALIRQHGSLHCISMNVH